MQWPSRHDPLFAQHQARLEVSVPALSAAPERGSAPFLEVLKPVLEAVAALPHRARRARGPTTATLKEIQKLLVHAQIADSSTFQLPAAVAKWAETEPLGERAGYKLHLRLSSGYGGVAQLAFSKASEHDSPHLDPLVAELKAGAILLADRGYLHHPRFDRWTAAGIFFVSKLRKNHAAEVLVTTDLGGVVLENGDQLLRERRVRLGAQAREGVEMQIAMALLLYALLVLYQRGEENWSPEYLLLELNVQLQKVYAAYVDELGRTGLPPPPVLEACLPACA